MKKVNIVLEGRDEVAILVALDEVKKAIEGGFRSGMDSSDDGSYRFDSTDEASRINQRRGR